MRIQKNPTPHEGEIAEENGILKIFLKGKWVDWREPCPLTPIKVSERLPETWETSDKGECWCAAERPYPNDPIKKWELRRVRNDDSHFPQDEFWLPYNALPS